MQKRQYCMKDKTYILMVKFKTIMKYIVFKRIRPVLVGLATILAPLAFGVSCSDWDDHYEGIAETGAAGGTLWEQMKGNAQLSDFCEVLEQTKVYRMHKKTPVSYADLLNSGQAFTVMAPVNGTFNKDSLLRLVQTVSGDSAVEKSFVQNHITRLLVSSKPGLTKMLMLNQKRLLMADGMIDNVPVTVANTKASNGVLHIMQRALAYKHNLFEMLCDNPLLSVIGISLSRFNEDEFDPDASVSNGSIDGVPVYVDSVVYERNRLLSSIGQLRDEDSTYLVVVPTAEGWNRVYEETAKYFQYEKSIEKRDSLQQYYTLRALLEDAVFNMTDQKSVNDSLISVPYIRTNRTFEKGKKVYHVFKKPFEPGGILYGAKPLTCSNGTIYTTDNWSFNPMETWFRDIYVETENATVIPPFKACTYNAHRHTADSISGNAYLQIIPERGTSNWEMIFQINNTLSGDYDIYAILLPQSVAGLESTKPCKFKATINYVDEDNNEQSFNCDNNQFQSDPERVDTILLAEGFHFPVCNYDQRNTKISIKITCSILARETSRYSREMLLDCIYLRPRTSKSVEQ